MRQKSRNKKEREGEDRDKNITNIYGCVRAQRRRRRRRRRSSSTEFNIFTVSDNEILLRKAGEKN